LGDALDVIRHHHEKLDGSGYPDGLEKDEVSNVARVMAAADIWDALITTRSYRQKMPKEKALQILMEEVRQGKLDGAVVDHLAAAISS
jgi:putative two-component system response regulator